MHQFFAMHTKLRSDEKPAPATLLLPAASSPSPGHADAVNDVPVVTMALTTSSVPAPAISTVGTASAPTTALAIGSLPIPIMSDSEHHSSTLDAVPDTSSAATVSEHVAICATVKHTAVANATCTAAVLRKPFSLSDPLPLPDGPLGLTQSEQIFTLATGQHPQSLRIDYGDEFYIFMRLRAEKKWWTCGMSPQTYVECTSVYNCELLGLARTKGHTFVPKNPRALYDKLGDIEKSILTRIQKNSFKCTYLRHLV